MRSMMKAKVFCPHRVTLDINDLNRYGEISYVFTRSIFPDEVDEVMSSIDSTIRAHLSREGFDANRDFFAMIGDPLLMASVVSIATTLNPAGPLRLLKFDKFYKRYYEGRLFPNGRPLVKPVLKGMIDV